MNETRKLLFVEVNSLWEGSKLKFTILDVVDVECPPRVTDDATWWKRVDNESGFCVQYHGDDNHNGSSDPFWTTDDEDGLEYATEHVLKLWERRVNEREKRIQEDIKSAKSQRDRIEELRNNEKR